MNRTIFISYRRDDSSAEAMLVRKALVEKLGSENVFMDASSIEPGAEWPGAIQEKLKGADAVVAVIGPEWLRAGTDEWGRRRIDEESDWVRRELEAALEARQLLIPLFVRGAKPQIPPDVLPQTIRGLSNVQGISIRRDYWDHDIELLLARLIARTTGSTSGQSLRSPFPVSNLTPPDRLSDEKLKSILEKELELWQHVKSQLPEKPAIVREELFRE